MMLCVCRPLSDRYFAISCAEASGFGTLPTSMLPITIRATKRMPPIGAQRSSRLRLTSPPADVERAGAVVVLVFICVLLGLVGSGRPKFPRRPRRRARHRDWSELTGSHTAAGCQDAGASIASRCHVDFG